eukprot:168778-Rhodomonas_salina.1
MWEVEHFRSDGTWVIPPEAGLSMDQASALLAQLRLGEWNDEVVAASAFGRHVVEQQGLKTLESGDAGPQASRIQLEVQPRARRSGRDHILAMRRAQFPHGSRRERDCNRYRCVQKDVDQPTLVHWLSLPPRQLVNALVGEGAAL